MKALTVNPSTPAEFLRRAIALVLDDQTMRASLPGTLPETFKMVHGDFDKLVELLAQAAERHLTPGGDAVDSAMSKLLTGSFYPTLTETLDAISARLTAAKAVPQADENWYDALNEHLPYETTRYRTFHISELKGKPVTQRAPHTFTVSIYRMPSGNYELTFYVS